MKQEKDYTQLGISIKFKGDRHLDKLFEQYRILVNDCLSEVNKIYCSYTQIAEPAKAECATCKNDKPLTHTNDDGDHCTTCFQKSWSEYTLWSNYHKPLEAKYNFFQGNQGYLNGALVNAVQIFKSYLAKKQKRDYEIKVKQEKLEALESDIKRLTFEKGAYEKKRKQDINYTEQFEETSTALRKAERDYKYLSKKKLRPITFPVFTRDAIYAGNQNMFRFIPDLKETYDLLNMGMVQGDFINIRKELSKQTSEGIQHSSWQVQITNPYEMRAKWTFPLNLGKRNVYQKKFILDAIEKQQWKLIRPKIVKRDNDYFLVYPARVIAEACTILDKEFKKNKSKDVTFCCLSFGVKKPVHLTAIKQGKIVSEKTFGDGTAYWKSERETNLKAKIAKNLWLHHTPLEHLFEVDKEEEQAFADQKQNKQSCFGLEFDQLNECGLCKVRQSCKANVLKIVRKVYPLRDDKQHLSKHLKKKIRRERLLFLKRHTNTKFRTAAKKIFQDKIGNRLSLYKNTYDHQLSHDIIAYCKKQFKNPVFIVRDTKNIKSISYPGMYRKVMKDWSINQQKLFTQYKGLLNGIQTHLVPYSDVNDMACPKCKKNLGKTTTMKLTHTTTITCECGFKDTFATQDNFLLYNATQTHLKKQK